MSQSSATKARGVKLPPYGVKHIFLGVFTLMLTAPTALIGATFSVLNILRNEEILVRSDPYGLDLITCLSLFGASVMLCVVGMLLILAALLCEIKEQ